MSTMNAKEAKAYDQVSFILVSFSVSSALIMTVDGFNVSQLYAIIVLPNGGPDLEAFVFSTPKARWSQACSLFWQVTRALAEVEDLVQFEVRALSLFSRPFSHKVSASRSSLGANPGERVQTFSELE